MAVKVNLPTLKKRQKTIKNGMDKILLKVGIKLRGHIIINWLRGRGADGTTLQRPSISARYKKRKVKSGRVGKIDLHWTGRLAQSLEAKKAGRNKVIVTPSQAEMGKARGNFETRPQMMKLKDAIKNDMIDFVFKLIRRAK